MPIYVYQVIQEDGKGETFEVEQPINSDPIDKHPLTGAPVHRVIQATNFNTQYTEQYEKKVTDPNYAASKGFTVYHKDQQTGKYNRATGNGGPETLDPKQHDSIGHSDSCSH